MADGDGNGGGNGGGIDYGAMMHDAMRGLIARVLQGVADEGLPGDHHFFVTFDTTHPGVDIADWLRERYPEEMTVVLQHWYENLEVGEDGFAVTLNFGDAPETLSIPWTALRTFVDPSVEFGLRFETRADAHRPGPALKPAPGPRVPAPRPEAASDGAPGPKPAPDAARGDAEVVQLDKFRK